METLIVVAVAIAVLGLLGWSGQGTLRGLAAACAAAIVVGSLLWEPGGDAALTEALPERTSEGGFVTSSACRACHPGAYDAWQNSYHRSMTQRATPATVLGDFDGVMLQDRGRTVRLERRGDEFWVEMPDPLWYRDPSPDRPPEPPPIEVRVVMTTGSHHLQNYWIRRPKTGVVHAESYDNGALVQMPWVWIVDEGRWVPGQDSFLTPPSEAHEPPIVWNTSCNVCHSVATQPRFAEGAFETRSAELGIACEACHGPGAEHVRANHSPVRRYLSHLGVGAGDATIINPADLPKERSAEVCGQCHSFSMVIDQARWRATGVPYRPGDVLEESKAVLQYEAEPRDPFLLRQLAAEPNALEGRYWADGTIRVAGREYNGMLESPCYQRGEMTCLSCHSMHGYAEPADQLARDRQGDEACLQCHPSLREAAAEHSHHPPESSGSRCANCHLPHTTYGLFVAMRAHRVDSPDVAQSARTGRPNACNLCHLDQTLAWSDRKLQEWYDRPAAQLDADQRTVAAGALWALTGDAAQRAITAWHMGWEPARRASGREWLGGYLAWLTNDPYSAVRRVAGHSLASLPGFEEFEYDYLDGADELGRRYEAARERWVRQMGEASRRDGARLLLDPQGGFRAEAFRRLSARRDDRPLRIIE
jgi:predicted CXXCH cytochrome family protein